MGGLVIVSVKPDAGLRTRVSFVATLLPANGADLLDPEALEKALRKAKAAGRKRAVALVPRSGAQVYVAPPAGAS